MNILLLGAPGAGKGTQGKEIEEKYNIPVISMGDMLREMIKTDKELSEKVVPYMQSGSLVPDVVVGEILKKRLKRSDCENGFVLDGYPRNEDQARLLDSIGVELQRVIEIRVSDEEILKRLSGRRVCGKCGEIYHIANKKPKIEGLCDVCEGDLEIRKDDQDETIKKRLVVFHNQTEPLERYYRDKGIFFVVDGEKDLKAVSKMLFSLIEGNGND